MTPPEEATLALELRIQLLETLVGLDTAYAKRSNAQEASIARRGQAVIAGIYEALDRTGTDAIKRFLETYELNKALLVPQLPTSSAQDGNDLTPAAKAALILDSEQDLKNLDRELREIDTLEKRGMAGAGRLEEHEALKPRLAELRKDASKLAGSYGSLESRVENLLTQYDDYVNTVSELFVSWNDAITQAEKTVSRIQKERSS
ncbi:hypothetical protein P389DRAFT_181618 [Cystobasidium minutum MCA 4210]|uniref:uncharacterized protein n=1 Tax=Cystobasidium minutum MCA 4210 TaxID=1397322 RepID=UPI0034CF794E|eukprot:jgi/Rhomi1/181618/fgenesh1_pg.7_\